MINECCLERAVAVRLEQARAAALARTLEQIGRVKSLAKAQEVARDALMADGLIAHAAFAARMRLPEETTPPAEQAPCPAPVGNGQMGGM